MSEVNIANDSFVGVLADDIVVLFPVPQRMDRERALRLAAWLAVRADPGGDDFAAILEAVRDT